MQPMDLIESDGVGEDSQRASLFNLEALPNELTDLTHIQKLAEHPHIIFGRQHDLTVSALECDPDVSFFTDMASVTQQIIDYTICVGREKGSHVFKGRHIFFETHQFHTCIDIAFIHSVLKGLLDIKKLRAFCNRFLVPLFETRRSLQTIPNLKMHVSFSNDASLTCGDWEPFVKAFAYYPWPILAPGMEFSAANTKLLCDLDDIQEQRKWHRFASRMLEEMVRLGEELYAEDLRNGVPDMDRSSSVRSRLTGIEPSNGSVNGKITRAIAKVLEEQRGILF